MPAARIGLVWLAAIASACSLSLDGDHFRGEPRAADPDAGSVVGGGGPDARDREDATPPPDPDAAPEPGDSCRETCGDDDCDLRCPEGECECTLDCAATSGTCKAKCDHRDCAIDCHEASRCEAGCKNADCTIDCSGAGECDRVKCEKDAGCLLDCNGADTCGFDVCEGEETSCAGGVLACNRDCP